VRIHAESFGDGVRKITENNAMPFSENLGDGLSEDRISPSIREIARRNHTAVLSALAQVSQTKVAELIGCSDSTVHRIKTQELETLSAFLAACCLKLVPVSAETLDEDYIRALRTLAGHGIKTAPKSKEVE
jgi:hypothetical protein